MILAPTCLNICKYIRNILNELSTELNFKKSNEIRY